MAKQTVKEFKEELYKLFDQRVYWLVNSIGGKKLGKPPKFTSKTVSKTIANLQKIALKSITDTLAKKEFGKLAEKRKQWHLKNKGWGIEKKKQNFEVWYTKNIPYRNCIYIFWSSKNGKHTCLYVGKTERGKGRPQNHFDKRWFGSVTRIDIYSVPSASQVMKLECLAIHRFNPKVNKNKAPEKKWYKKCPVCEVLSLINGELRSIFSLKKKR